MWTDGAWYERRLIGLHRLTKDVQRIPGFGYALAVTAFGLAFLLRHASDHYLPAGFPFLTFFPAVILSSVFGGARAGVLCAVLSLLAAWRFFIAPENEFGVNGPVILALAYFALVATIDIAIIAWLNKTIAALEVEKERSRALAEERLGLARHQRSLFQELQHRTANNLAMVASLLSITQRKLKHIPEAVDVLQDARLRIDQMSRVHRRLYDPSTDAVRLDRYFRELCEDLLTTGGVSDYDLAVDCDPIELSVQQLTNLSMIVLEALMNSLKHADSAASRLSLSLHFKRQEDGAAVLEVQDNGGGYPDNFDPSTSRQLGFRLIQSFAEGLRGEARFFNRNGAVVSVMFKPCSENHSFE
ncbi:two-component sensor histidine kinase [Rhizobium sp. SG_E_25_P2]|uniref:sensor histidine kinase n=1 Tax=Rhizobium sp. SG_E_25_P2 TaxID=2879942 RepID=UPI0024756874|nr:histidine kinase dimerization/phosphoacceptor domain -containing protein [Rhizobium sp. SG_E_25_P2]MDH6268087.1 two-component sensor histidine kinase [Rhizobium sp. SG_E_25_P2]